MKTKEKRLFNEIDDIRHSLSNVEESIKQLKWVESYLKEILDKKKKVYYKLIESTKKFGN